MTNVMHALMNNVEDVISGSSRGLLIVSDNLFLKKQVEAFIKANQKAYHWFTGDMTANVFFELLNGENILVFDGLHYNKRTLSGLLYRSVVEPVGQSSKIVFKDKKTEFNGRIILFGSTIIKQPAVRACFQIWTE